MIAILKTKDVLQQKEQEVAESSKNFELIIFILILCTSYYTYNIVVDCQNLEY